VVKLLAPLEELLEGAEAAEAKVLVEAEPAAAVVEIVAEIVAVVAEIAAVVEVAEQKVYVGSF